MLHSPGITSHGGFMSEKLGDFNAKIQAKDGATN
jgi:hypothetical protein